MRPRGGIIGSTVTPTLAGASGAWHAREQEAFQRASVWPYLGYIVPSITGLQLWLDAADASTLFDETSGGSLVAPDGAVARWQDKSGNGRHATQSTASRRPIRKANAQNGRDGLLFDATNDSMQIDAGWGQFGANDFSVFCAFRLGANATSHLNGIIVSQNNTNDAAPIFRVEVLSASYSNTIRTNTFSAVTTQGISVSNNTAYIASGTRSSSQLIARLGNSSSLINDLSGTLNLNPPANVGRFIDESGGNGWYFEGHILEIFSYNSALSDANRTAVESYLMAKWGIT